MSVDLGVPTSFLMKRAGHPQPVNVPAGVGCGSEQGPPLPGAGKGGSVSLLSLVQMAGPHLLWEPPGAWSRG